jgi:hypothetical protein
MNENNIVISNVSYKLMHVRILYKPGSLMTVPKEVSKCKLLSVGVQEVRWNRGGTEPTGKYTYFYGKGNENH